MSVQRPTRIGLIRHGETDWNTERRIQGQTDIALNAEGLRQARAAAASLRSCRASALYASDLSRAWVTAQAVGAACGLAPRPMPELRERRYGVFEGLLFDTARDEYPDWFEQLEARQPDFVLPQGGESLLDLQRRVLDGLAGMLAKHAGETVLVVTHGGVLDIVNRAVRGIELSPPRDFVIPNAGINWIRHENGCWHLDAWAVTEHLGVALDEL